MIRRTEGPDEFGAQSSCPRLMGGRWGVGSCPSLQGSQDWLGAGVVPHPHPALCMFPNFVTLYVHHSLEPGDARPAGVEAIAVPFPPRSHFLPVPSISPPPSPKHRTPLSTRAPAPAQASQISLKVNEFPDQGPSGTQLRLPFSWQRLVSAERS